jgi:hypothetical protein
MIPVRQKRRIRDMLVIIGGMYPLLIIQGVINFENPYPHTFLLTVMATNMEPATGLYESIE